MVKSRIENATEDMPTQSTGSISDCSGQDGTPVRPSHPYETSSYRTRALAVGAALGVLTTPVGAATILATSGNEADSVYPGTASFESTAVSLPRTRSALQLTHTSRIQSVDPRSHWAEDGSPYDDNDESLVPSSVPQLEDLLDGTDVVGDVSWMLDFAIVGNAKCGTTFLSHYISHGSDQTYMPPNEVCKLSKDQPEELVKLLYDQHLAEIEAQASISASALENELVQEQRRHDEYASRIRHGLKCPKELGTEHALRNYAAFFPETDFIVTTRHPVLWFQSFYNFRFGDSPSTPPAPAELVGACLDDSPYLCGQKCGRTTFKENVCTDRGAFHHQLARFGKTPLSDQDELRLLEGSGMETVPVGGRVFLLELGQLFPGTESSRNLPGDLSDFLRLEQNLPDIVPTARHSGEEEESRPYLIDICDDEFTAIRALLVEAGVKAATWIREYFLQSQDVVVSTRGEFLDLIEEWGSDPCEDRVKMRRMLGMQSMFDM